MTLEYAMLLITDVDGDINASFPDLPGCNTWGRNEDEAMEYAIEALQAHANEMMRQGKRMPDPSKCELKTLKVRMIEVTNYKERMISAKETTNKKAATESLRNEIATWNYDLDDREIIFRGSCLNGSFSNKDILDAYAETHKEPPEPAIPKPETKTYKARVAKEPEKDIMPTEPKPKRGRTPKEKHPSGVDLEYVEHIKNCLERTSDFKTAANRMSGLLQNQNAE